MTSRRSISVTVGGVCLVAGLLACGGCGPDFGAVLYTFGLYPKQKIPAEYKLPPGPMLILVDDDQDVVQPPHARDMLVDELARKLKEHELADRVTTNEEIARIRQGEPKFHERGVREVGRLVKADTVIWLKVSDFSLPANLEMVITPARFTASLRVINAKAETAADVRLWPKDSEGRNVEATVSVHDIRRSADVAEAHQKLAAALAEQVCNLFIDRTVEE